MRYQKIIFQNPNLPIRIHYGKYHEQDIFCDMHFHPELEFVAVRAGSMEYSVGNTKTIAHKGDILFFNSMVPHSTDTKRGENYSLVLQFPNPSLSKGSTRHLQAFLKESENAFFHFQKEDMDTQLLLGYLTQITEEINSENGSDYSITANLYHILALLHQRRILSDRSKPIDSEAMHKMMPVFQYMEEHFAEQISLTQLSKLLNFNESYFCRIFKKATNHTAIDYLNFIRVRNAELLLKSEKSISEISDTVGFSSLSYFNRIFHKYHHCSPSEYRRVMNRPHISEI